MKRFAAGFVGGASLTSAALYMSLLAHWSARSAQRALLQQQAEQLNQACARDGTAAAAAVACLTGPNRDGAARAGMSVALRDRWNDRLAGLAAWALGVGMS